MSNRDEGFTLIELLIVVAIIGIIAAIAIPNLVSALDNARQRATMADIRQVSQAVERYSIDSNSYPAVSGSIDGNLDQHVEPHYVQRCPDEDGWGHPLQYASDGRQYTLRSPGKNGQTEPLVNGGEGGPTGTFDADLVLVDGSWIQWPKGRQDN